MIAKYGKGQAGERTQERRPTITLPEICEEEVRGDPKLNEEMRSNNQKSGWRIFDEWSPEQLAELNISTIGEIPRNCVEAVTRANKNDNE